MKHYVTYTGGPFLPLYMEMVYMKMLLNDETLYNLHRWPFSPSIHVNDVHENAAE